MAFVQGGTEELGKKSYCTMSSHNSFDLIIHKIPCEFIEINSIKMQVRGFTARMKIIDKNLDDKLQSMRVDYGLFNSNSANFHPEHLSKFIVSFRYNVYL